MTSRKRPPRRSVQEVERWGYRALFQAAEPDGTRRRRVAQAHAQNARWSRASLEPDSPLASCKTLETMDAEELRELEAQYGPLSEGAKKRAGKLVSK